MNYLKIFTAFVSELISRRQIIVEMTRRDFRNKYLGSYLGMLWAFVHPTVLPRPQGHHQDGRRVPQRQLQRPEHVAEQRLHEPHRPPVGPHHPDAGQPLPRRAPPRQRLPGHVPAPARREDEEERQELPQPGERLDVADQIAADGLEEQRRHPEEEDAARVGQPGEGPGPQPRQRQRHRHALGRLHLQGRARLHAL